MAEGFVYALRGYGCMYCYTFARNKRRLRESSSSQMYWKVRGVRRTGSVRERPMTVANNAKSMKVTAAASIEVEDHFATLGLSYGASKSNIKTAYRRLALQYHPDVTVVSPKYFMEINAAYQVALNFSSTSGEISTINAGVCGGDEYMEEMYGVGDDSWEEWEEWMGWEGAGTYDYSSFE